MSALHRTSRQRRWWIREPGAVYPFNVRARNESEAREKARLFLGVDRLKRGTEVWCDGDAAR